MQNILFPTDFSANAHRAMACAVDIVNRFGATLTLVHAYKVYSNAGMFISVESYMEEDIAEQMLKLIREIEPQLEGQARVVSKTIKGDAIPAIASLADSGMYDLIIMGTQGASGLEEIFSGSITNGIIQRVRIPVLAIPQAYQWEAPSRMVFALDQKPISAFRVVRSLTQLAKVYDAHVSVFHQDTGADDAGVDPGIEMYLEMIEYSFTYELDENKVGESISEFVEDTDGQLLCMIRRERSFMERIFHSSNTKREAFHSKVPLLILHDVA